MTIRSQAELDGMRRAGAVVKAVLGALARAVEPGVRKSGWSRCRLDAFSAWDPPSLATPLGDRACAVADT